MCLRLVAIRSVEDIEQTFKRYRWLYNLYPAERVAPLITGCSEGGAVTQKNSCFTKCVVNRVDPDS